MRRIGRCVAVRAAFRPVVHRRQRFGAGGAKIIHVEDPRVELQEHYYRAAHTKLLDLGLMPFLLGDELLADLLAIARTHVDRIELSALAPKVQWRTTSSQISRTGKTAWMKSPTPRRPGARWIEAGSRRPRD